MLQGGKNHAYIVIDNPITNSAWENLSKLGGGDSDRSLPVR